MEKKDKSFAEKFIKIISENSDSNKFSITKMNDMINGIRVTDKKNHINISIFESDLHYTETTNDKRVAVIYNGKALFFDANNKRKKYNRSD